MTPGPDDTSVTLDPDDTSVPPDSDNTSLTSGPDDTSVTWVALRTRWPWERWPISPTALVISCSVYRMTAAPSGRRGRDSVMRHVFAVCTARDREACWGIMFQAAWESWPGAGACRHSHYTAELCWQVEVVYLA